MADLGCHRRALRLTAASGVLLLTGCVNPLLGGDNSTPTPAPATSVPAETPSPQTSRPSSDELARSVVQVVQLNAQGESVCSYGSGTILDSAGTILTNFHVIRSDQCAYSAIGIAITSSVDEAPTLKYLADAYAVDPGLDLAVLRISSTLGGGRVTGTFPFVGRGNSDEVHLGDEIDILGYPGIGGRTITYTEGKISGFSSSPDVDGRAWLKTDGTITGGNSGGLGADADGRIVGVPTLATGNPDSDRVTDCRRLQDTDGDGDVDDDDSCIPIGGFLNSLRPINLAGPLIEEAARAQAIPVEDLAPADGPAASDPVISAVRFASDVDADDKPIDRVVTLPTGADRICAFLDYGGLSDGTAWDAVWKVDGEVDATASLTGQTWNQGESGTTWVCSGIRDDTPVTDGLWELSVYLDGSEEPSRSRSIYVGDAHAPVEVTVVNRLEKPVCFLYLAPDQASTWESDRLGRDESLDRGASVALDLPAGQYDVLARDCADSPKDLTELDGVDITVNGTIELR